MKRLMVLLLAVAIVPGSASGQMPPERRSDVEVAPFLAIRFPQALTTQRDGSAGTGDYLFALDRRTTPVVGLEARVPLTRDWGVVAAAGYALRGDELIEVRSPAGVDIYSNGYGHLLFVRGDVQYRFPEPDPASDARLHHPSLHAFAGPALVIGWPPPDPVAPPYLTARYTQVAAHFGLRATGDIPFWSHLGFELSGEDFALLTNRSIRQERLERFFQEGGRTDGSGTLVGGGGHIFGLRAGLVWHP